MADWALDPDSIASTVQRRQTSDSAPVGLVVPASLHGIDWAGDPTASIPCAERQLHRLAHRFDAGAVPVDFKTVGDPDPVAAAWDALEDWSADEILLFSRERRLNAPFLLRLDRRIERAIGLPVSRLVVVREPASTPRRSLWRGRVCVSPQPQTS